MPFSGGRPPLPPVVVIPLPRGGILGPVKPLNTLSLEQTQPEEDERKDDKDEKQDEEGICPIGSDTDLEYLKEDEEWWPMAEVSDSGVTSSISGAGVGTPITSTVTATKTSSLNSP